MEERFLIDSSAVIKYLNNSLPGAAIAFLDEALDKEVNLSIITKVEILAWVPPNPGDLLTVQQFAESAFVFMIDERIGNIAVSIRRATNVKLPDVLIAASAIAHDFTLIADNDKDFDKIVALGIGFRYLHRV